MRVLTPDDNLEEEIDRSKFTIFLAGNLQSKWREEVIDLLSEQDLDIVVLDPQVDDWDDRIGNEEADNPAFVAQTDWEHMGLIMADVEVFFFDEKSVSPITLVEFGLYKTKESIIHLTEGYEKAGYLRYVSRRFGLPVVSSVKELAQLIMIRYKLACLQD